MTAQLDERRRRAAYRAAHRGTKEMDWLLGKYADAHLATLADSDVDEFEQFMALPEPQLQAWLMSGSGYQGNAFAPLIDKIRAFHGLTQKG